jgi:hypothetical protein
VYGNCAVGPNVHYVVFVRGDTRVYRLKRVTDIAWGGGRGGMQLEGMKLF